ncbi:MAG: cobyrinate a,c-diamide synthase [Acidimicrobiales bacterium]
MGHDRMGATLGPRVVVAGTHSGVGKTTVATGMLAALRRAGHRPSAAKVGPDFIDPGYHSLACGRPPRNLDAWMCGTGVIASLAGRAMTPDADVLVVEGVMGLFDGAGDGAPSSTADVAKLLRAPVLLVVDAAALSGSVAALVSGYARFDPDLRVAGVVLNRVGSEGHGILLREALAPLDIPVVGALRRDDRFTWRDRHLGLVPVVEQADTVARSLDQLATAIAEAVDLDAVLRLAREAPTLRVGPVPLPRRVAASTTSPLPVAVAAGAAFSFTYTDTLDALVAAGLEPVPFDPRHDAALPHGACGLLAGGGFPEVHGAELSANRPLLADVRRGAAAGLPIWAECGGLLWLCRSLDGLPMADVLPADARMTDRLTLGYRTARSTAASPVGPVDTVLRGHEFHYSVVEPGGTALDLEARWGTRPDGYATPTLLATYLHVHPGGDPTPVERFARACVSHRAGPSC